MSAEDRVKVLEGEFKLIKSELRQTLSSVRDFLLDLKIPQIQEEVARKAQAEQQQPQPQSGGGNGQQGGGGNNEQPGAPQGFPEGGMPEMEAPVLPQQEPPTELDLPDTPGEASADAPVAQDEETSGSVDLPEDLGSDDTGMSSGDMPGDEKPETGPRTEKAREPAAEGPITPQVNLLANLIRWASLAKKEIGMGQLPVFLDVYATTGNLNQETKDTILHLAEVATDPVADGAAPEKSGPVSEEIAICMDINGIVGQLPPEFKEKIHRLTELILQRSAGSNKADIWSQLMLELHGILTGVGTSLQPLSVLRNSANQEEEGPGLEGYDEQFTEITDEPETASEHKYTRPARLRLVLPTNSGTEQELDLGSLFISTDSPAKSDLPAKKGNGRKNTVSYNKR